MKKKRLLKFILGLLFISISIISFYNYLEFKSSFINNKSLSYSFVEKRINRGGRGESYEMDFLYNNKKHSISITSNEYNLIEEGKYPDLYFSERSGNFFSKWEAKKSFRISLLFFSLFIFTIIPYTYIINKLK
ncbi:hypothetical protein [Flavobacterium sp. T12S277]|uniref:hypothetical protein n=1 Tax=Flavobacterium sp. T12S277 TaxID=3402752 RepID=UPI003ADBB96D